MGGLSWDDRKGLLEKRSLEAQEAGKEEDSLVLSSLVELCEWSKRISREQETLEKETERLLKETQHLVIMTSQLSRRLAELESRVHEEPE